MPPLSSFVLSSCDCDHVPLEPDAVRVADSVIEPLRVHPEVVFRIQLHVGHWLELRFVKGRKLRFGPAEFLEMFAGVGESVVIGVGRAVAPSQRVSFRGGGDSGFALALFRRNPKLAAPSFLLFCAVLKVVFVDSGIFGK